MYQASKQLETVFEDYGHNVKTDNENNVVYFTLNLDAGASEWMGTHSSAVCYDLIDGEYMVTEYDIRLSEVPVGVVNSVVDDLSMRYKMHIDTVDSGHGSESIAHLRNYNARIRLKDFEEFFKQLYKDIKQELD